MNGGSMWNLLAQKPGLKPLEFDKAFVSKDYASGKGTLALLVHSGLDKTTLGKIMKAMDKSDYNKAFVIYPCDLSVKGLPAWLEEADAAYPSAKRICVTVGTDGSPALSSASQFERTIFIDSAFSSAPTLKKDQKVYYATTDDAPTYAGMNALYNACKASEASFEYRVLNSCRDPLEDWTISINSIISTIIY